MEQEILNAAEIYLNYTGETVNSEFLQLLVDRVIESYRQQRNYPKDMSEEDIQEDVERYFTNKKSYVATDVIPAMLGKVGGEHLTALIDNQVSRYWDAGTPVYLPDVVPYCQIP